MTSKSRLFLNSWFILFYVFFFNDLFLVSIYIYFFDIDSVDVKFNKPTGAVCILLPLDRLCIQSWLYRS